jgi:hypothetical protein
MRLPDRVLVVTDRVQAKRPLTAIIEELVQAGRVGSGCASATSLQTRAAGSPAICSTSSARRARG